MHAAFGILCSYKDFRRLKKWDVSGDWLLGFKRKEEGQCFVEFKRKKKSYFCRQRPKIHYGVIVVNMGVVTEIVWLVFIQTHP